jgi:hypothetical protein
MTIGIISASEVLGAPPPPAVSGYPAAVLADIPLAYYRLGESSGATMIDSSSNSRNGSYVGSPGLGASGLLAGDSDKALNLPGGLGNYAKIDAASWMQVTTFTVECIIKPGTITGNHAIVGRANYEDSFSAAGRSWYIHQSNANLVIGVYTGNTGTVYIDTTAFTGLVIGKTYHLALTFDGTIVRFYVNGIQVYSGALTGTLRPAAGINLTLGAEHSDTISERFLGVLDEVAYYGSALPAVRVAEHYALSAGLSDFDAFSGPALSSEWTRQTITSSHETLDSSGMDLDVIGAGEGYYKSLASLGLTASDDFTVEVEFGKSSTAAMIGPWILDDSGTGVQASNYSNPNALLTLRASSWGYGGSFAQGVAGNVNPCRLRLRKQGTSYYSSRSVDGGATWSVETTAFTWTGTPTRVGFGSILNSAALTNIKPFKVTKP